MKIAIFKHLLFAIFFIAVSCTEPYALQTNTFEDAIVIEATITNEFKKQEIKISRTYRFEENGPKIEQGAIVYIIDDLGNQYNFIEIDGKYISENEFQAQSNRTYELHVITANGKSYVSTKEKLTTESPITEVIPEVITKEGVRGVQISVKSYDPTNTSKYYRYEFDETYKVIAPKWTAHKAVVTGPESYELVLRNTEAKTCYGKAKSNEILITSTNNQFEDRVNFPVRFISNKNYIISHRYSILVKQYIQNLNAYTYYQTLKKISGSGSILSQNQPGFFEGNIKSNSSPDEKIIGFFDVCSVSEKRMFFNYSDLFPGEPLPPYITECNEDDVKNQFLYCFSYTQPGCKGYSFLQQIDYNLICYYDKLESPNPPLNDIITAFDIKCGDCTSFSSNIKPAFWID